MAEPKQYKLVLTSTKDWDPWLAVVRAKATSADVWDYINPTHNIKPIGSIKPLEPDLDQQPGATIIEQSARFKIEYSKYKTRTAEFKEKKDAFAKLIAHIFDTVHPTNITFIEKEEVHPWDLLRALKARFAPSDQARALDLEQSYRRLTKGPSNRQGAEAWVDDYLKMYAQAKEARIAEVVDGARAYRDFLQAIEKLAPTFAQVYQVLVDDVTDYDQKLKAVIVKFRHHVRLEETKKGKGLATHSAFATSGQQSTTFRGEETPVPQCICGYTHWFSDCYYLNENKRPAGWKPNASVQQKVDNAMKDERKQKQVEKSLARTKRRKDRDSTPSTPTQEADVGSFAVQSSSQYGVFPTALEEDFQTGIFTSKSASTYLLHSSWILDHGSGVHVANKSMADRFEKHLDCTDGSTVMSGNGPLPIKAYGQIRITTKTPKGKGVVTLTKVCYVPDFMVNVVAGSILADKGLHFDTQHSHLHRNGTPVVLVPRVGGHYVLEDNSKGVAASFAATAASRCRSGTTLDWHQLLAHANNDAIQHLPAAVEGVELTNKDLVPKTNKCETCALAKAKRIVSRRTYKSESSTKPFHRITYDLIDMTTAINKDKWISHIACSTTGFHLVYTHSGKSQATETLIRAILLIETRYAGKVVFVRSDGERALVK